MKYALRGLAFAFFVAFSSSEVSTTGAEKRTKVTMRDGIMIETYLKTPPGNGSWPAVFKKGYGITTGGADTFNKAGYAFVSQGVRGGPDPHGISGDARFFADDVDGYDTIEWIARQPWCDGQVAMFGPSYWGATQWLAAANGDPGPPPHLKAIIPSVINLPRYDAAVACRAAHHPTGTTRKMANVSQPPRTAPDPLVHRWGQGRFFIGREITLIDSP